MKSAKKIAFVRLFSALVILMLALTSATTSYAQVIPVSQKTITKPSLTVNFIGGVGDKLFFEVVMEQPEDSRSYLRIRDEDGMQLYNELVTKSTLVKKIQVPKNEMKKVEFVFETGKEELKKSFEIKVQYKETLEIRDVTKM